MSNLGGTIDDALSSITTAEVQANESDYMVGDILYCGNCKSPKQKHIMMPCFKGGREARDTIVRCLCKCEVAQQEAEALERKREEAKKEVARLRGLSLIEPRLMNARLNTFKVNKDNEKAFSIVRRYIDNFDTMYQNSQGVMFYGSVGTGKSYAAAVIANELIDRGIPVVMTSFVKILQQLRDFKVDEEEYTRRIISAKVLILDDLGTERDTGYAIEKIYSIVDGRYLSKKPLIVTTNLSLADMKQCDDVRYKRVYDRVFEMCYPVQLTGSSWRMQEAARRFDNMKSILEG